MKRWCVRFVDPVEEVTTAGAYGETEFGSWPVEPAVASGGRLDFDPEVLAVVIGGTPAGCPRPRSGGIPEAP